MKESGADVVVPVNKHGYEPFHAMYRRKPCLPAALEGVTAGERRAQTMFDKVNVRVAFSERSGGTSVGAYASLNLAAHVEDDLDAVHANRRRFMEALGLKEAALVVPKQVHGDRVVALRKATAQSVGAEPPVFTETALAIIEPLRPEAAEIFP